MTVKELLGHMKTTYLFTQQGWDFYACGSRFYKVFKDVVLPAER
ncbi:hypothetical protein CLMAG_13800 [Clostridium magnum DSM 2767]|uniref:Uncharacterized protein n=1 Tax=Clostridium magnum DSM 2767 TaxID=1121326 RepID=A0A162UVE4_9CLOT|nr:hypothetical protein CLMAG_13800 [Clostridium magnum DSM 2767]SHJ54892.1 hypothetical protein SAMN02745944_06141 [Clostridium magnum DSM 2767]